MTDQWGFASDDANDFTQAQPQDNKGLRGWAESVNKQNKELKDQLAQVQQQLQRQQAVNLFEDLGLNKSAASLYNGELTPDAVNAWASQIRNAFGVETTPTEQPPAAPPALTPEQQQTFQNITQAGANAAPSTQMDDFQRGVNNANSIQDLLAQWQQIPR